MRTYAGVKDEILKKLFPRKSPRDVLWKDKMYELKRSIGGCPYAPFTTHNT